jgi:hypothetical protein
MTAPVANRPLSRMQIDAIVTRVRNNFTKSTNTSFKAREKKNKEDRLRLFEAMLKPSLAPKIKKQLVECLECNLSDEVPGVPDELNSYDDPIREKFNSIVEDLKFELTMTGVVGYEAIVKAFEAKIAKLTT